MDAIAGGMISKTTAIEDVRLGLNALHDKGMAHCDVVVDNVFVVDRVAILHDLEYLTRLTSAAPQTSRWDVLQHGTLTAGELDGLLFSQFMLTMQ